MMRRQAALVFAMYGAVCVWIPLTPLVMTWLDSTHQSHPSSLRNSAIILGVGVVLLTIAAWLFFGGRKKVKQAKPQPFHIDELP